VPPPGGAHSPFRGGRGPVLEPDDLDYTREVLRPHLGSSHPPVLLAALYGDEAARSVGYPPLGLSADAGLALARADALAAAEGPEAAISAP
jgi:hypothetical protein